MKLPLSLFTPFSLFLLLACGTPEAIGQPAEMVKPHDLRVPASMTPAVAASTFNRFRDSVITRPAPFFYQVINQGWKYGMGDPSLGLEVSLQDRPALDTVVHLPHRVNQPNWPFWYEKSLTLTHEVYLYAKGDDGVQCFINGKLQPPAMGNYFRIPASPEPVRVSVRVLNNAMSGGLQKAALMYPKDFKAYAMNRREMLLQQALKYLQEQGVSTADNNRAAEINRVLLAEDTVAMIKLISEFPDLLQPGWPAAEEFHSDRPGFSFTAWGDSQGGWNTFSKLVTNMAGSNDDFSIGLGDLVSNGSDEYEWQQFLQCLQPLLKKQNVITVPGNHDYDGYYHTLEPLLYKKYILGEENSHTYQNWEYNEAIFLTLDPNQQFPLGIGDEQYRWMTGLMNSPAWNNARWRFLLIHQPPYSQGWPGYHGDAFIRELVDSLAEDREIDLVLSGHSHDYERLVKKYGEQQTHFVILGGAGGSLEPDSSSAYPAMDKVIKQHHYARFKVQKNKITVTILGITNEILDQFEVVKQTTE